MNTRVHKVEQHRTPLSGVDVVTYVSNDSFPRHSHDQVGFGLLGFGRHRSWSGLGTVDARSGDIICVNPGEMHDGAPLGKTPRGWRMAYVDPSVVDREISPGFMRQPEILRPVIRDPLLAACVAQLFASTTAPCPDALICEQDLLCCLARLFQGHAVQRSKDPKHSPSVSKALELLNSEPAKSISLGEMAALSGLSRFQFLRAFARETGITPHAYVIQLRVRLAQRFLREGHTIVETSIRAGFADQSHLTRCFVRQLGVTPHRFRAAVC